MTDYAAELLELLNETRNPVVLVFIEAEDCNGRHPVEQHLHSFQRDAPRDWLLHVVCHRLDDMPLPHPKADYLYFLQPGSTRPLAHAPATMERERFYRYLDAVWAVMDDPAVEFWEAFWDPDTRERIQAAEEALEEDAGKQWPSFMQMVNNLTRDMVRSAKRAQRQLPVIAPATVGAERMAICRDCRYLEENTRCRQCGCMMAAKVRVAASRCPLGKWEAM